MPDPASSVTAAAPTLVCKAGEHLFHEGERHGALFVIESGQVELLRAGEQGTERLALLGAGDVLGEDAAFERRAANCSARAVIESRLVRVAADAFLDVLRVRPEIAAKVVAALGRRLFEARAACLLALSEVTPLGPGAATAAGIPGVGGTPLFGAAKPAPAIAARLEHVETGWSFPLPAEGNAVVGRNDPRSKSLPDIDLSGLDVGRSLSRRHAVIARTAAGYQLTEEPRVANGTFVKGERVKPGVPVAIGDGDEVCFGLVRTVFRTT